MISVRSANRDDRDELLRWRNDPVTRNNSLSTAVVTPEEHAIWFDRVLANPQRFLYIGVHDQENIGTVRFDVEDSHAEVSIMTSPSSRGRGFARPLLGSAIEQLTQEAPLVEDIIATIRIGNSASFRLFEAAHFVEFQRQDDIATLRLVIGLARVDQAHP